MTHKVRCLQENNLLVTKEYLLTICCFALRHLGNLKCNLRVLVARVAYMQLREVQCEAMISLFLKAIREVSSYFLTSGRMYHDLVSRFWLSRYCYRPLEALNNIRVIRFSAFNTDRIECTIEQISFSSGGYRALSYVWGNDQRPYRAVVLDGHDVAVGCIQLTRNLHDALSSLYASGEIEGESYWIDQICINQEGEEKGHQVALMGQIYRNAKEVVTYLGPEDNEDEAGRGIKLLQQINSHFDSNFTQMLDMNANFLDIWRRRGELKVQSLPESLQELTYEDYRWLVKIAWGEWTQRLWIVQEQLLSQDIIMLRGQHFLSWYAVAGILTLFFLDLLPEQHVYRFFAEKAKGQDESQLSQSAWISPWYVVHAVFDLWQQRHLRTDDTGKYGTKSLIEQLDAYPLHHCRDDRDRVYALQAISRDAEELQIIPDYSEQNSVTNFSRDVAIRIIMNSADLLSLSVYCRLNDRINSRSPSWALRPSRSNHPKPGFIADSTRLLTHPWRYFHTPPRFDSAHSTLILKGRRVSIIVFATTPYHVNRSVNHDVIDQPWIQTFSKLLCNWCKILLRLGITLDHASSLACAITLDLEWSPMPNSTKSSTEEQVYHFWCYLRSMAQKLTANTECKDDQITDVVLKRLDDVISSLAALVLTPHDLQSFQSSDDLTTEQQIVAQEYSNSIIWSGRTFCTTEQGRVCSVINEAREGDELVAFQGWHQGFFLLRPAGGQYRLIGASGWISGCMQGEAYQGLDPDEVDYDIEIV